MSDGDFHIHAQLEAFEKADDPDGHTMRIGGICTTDHLDKQAERVLQQGLDFTPFLADGWFNDNHSQKTVDIVGYPSNARFVKKGERLPTGKSARSSGWWTEGYLLNTDQGRQLWGLAQALRESPRKLGFSIEGKVVKRSPKDKKIITRAVVKNVAVTACPVNTHTELVPLIKALSAGHAIDSGDLNQGPGDGGALRQESLEGGPNRQGWKAEDDEDDPDLVTLTEDQDGGEPNNGGWAGLNLHKSGGKIKREPSNEELLQMFGPTIEELQNQDQEQLRKSEAAQYLLQRRPDLTDAQLERILASAGGQ